MGKKEYLPKTERELINYLVGVISKTLEVLENITTDEFSKGVDKERRSSLAKAMKMPKK